MMISASIQRVDKGVVINENRNIDGNQNKKRRLLVIVLLIIKYCCRFSPPDGDVLFKLRKRKPKSKGT